MDRHEVARGGLHTTFPARVGLASQLLAGSGMVRPLFPFQDRRAGWATWAGVVVGSRRKATRLAHLWQAHRLIAEARGKAIRAKRTEQNPTN